LGLKDLARSSKWEPGEVLEGAWLKFSIPSNARTKEKVTQGGAVGRWREVCSELLSWGVDGVA
jgi:hypothetical protein